MLEETTRAGWESWSEKQIEQQLSPDGLVRRWDGQENCFLPCTYRLLECLARCERGDGSASRKPLLTPTTCGYSPGRPSGHRGAWGQLPQAFSYLGLINFA